jgi:hypothetical protein
MVDYSGYRYQNPPGLGYFQETSPNNPRTKLAVVFSPMHAHVDAIPLVPAIQVVVREFLCYIAGYHIYEASEFRQ